MTRYICDCCGHLSGYHAYSENPIGKCKTSSCDCQMFIWTEEDWNKKIKAITNKIKKAEHPDCCGNGEDKLRTHPSGNICCQGCYKIGLAQGKEEGKVEGKQEAEDIKAELLAEHYQKGLKEGKEIAREVKLANHYQKGRSDAIVEFSEKLNKEFHIGVDYNESEIGKHVDKIRQEMLNK